MAGAATPAPERRKPFGFVAVALAAAGGAVAITLLMSVPSQDDPLAGIRGTEAYYGAQARERQFPAVLVNLRGDDRHFETSVTVAYRSGPDLTDAEARFDVREARVRDLLVCGLSEAALGDVDEPAVMMVLLERLRADVDRVVFPDRRGRVERIFIEPFAVR